ncbi:MAG: hypothetical protein AAFQ40_01285 [Cyanobacteria bacterium J06623_5]
MKRYQSRTLGQRLNHPVVKSLGLFVVALSLGLTVFGPEGYSAIASEVLPKFSLSAEADGEKAVPRVHQFSMSVVGGRSTTEALTKYKIFETTLTDQDGEIKATLRLQATGQNQPIKEFESAVSEAQFVALWQQIRDLEVAQLTDVSPYTENLDEGPVRLVERNISSATYGFHFKDGVYDYPNSFEVYAPEHLEDSRYQSLKMLSLSFAQEIFGGQLSE